ncbi:Dps family protein [Telmatospirillum siberiense]|uniref:DNA starvation/stationary phase protection protein n=1 Tax=Telmatospirillum siberiense TaxID=382514 RepID=A0A2N3PXM9_9PROT|nr:DNA starvation/stationary phase protection protein [Telmatospirillum siberiense]PKU25148.1 DNA starvation/stationary phase protection protein [Telmatospirillum siberiense]
MARKIEKKRTSESLGGFSIEAVDDVSNAMNALIADVFSLFVKTKNFHWHVSGPHFRDYHLLFDDQASQILALVDAMAERVRKIGGTTIRSIGHIERLSQIAGNEEDLLSPPAMLAELCADNAALAERMRQTHSLCDEHGDVASTSLLENWIDEAELRVWFLAETGRSS